MDGLVVSCGADTPHTVVFFGVKETKRQRVKESKSQRDEETERRGVKESKRQRVKETKRRRVARRLFGQSLNRG